MLRRSALLLLCSPIPISTVFAQAQPARTDPRLTIEEVVRLTRAGFAEDIIITKIKKNGKAFDLSTDELLDLKKAGVTDNVIKYLLDPSQPYSAPLPPSPAPAASTPAKPATPAKNFPADPFANQVPVDPGLYFFPSAEPIKVDLKFLMGAEQAKSLMKKGKATAYLLGPQAKTRLKAPPAALYVRLPEGKEIAELVLLTLTLKNGRREVEVGVPGPKQQLKAEQMRPFEPLEVGPKLYQLTPAKLSSGEFILFFIGSAEPAKGIYGKGYDFGIGPAAVPTKN